MFSTSDHATVVVRDFGRALAVREAKDVDALRKSFREANANRRIARHIVSRLGETKEV